MYIQRVQLKHIKGFEELEWSPDQESPEAGWHVILGDNASGKSSLLRAIALALVGPREAYGLRHDLSSLVRQGCDKAQITLTLIRSQEDQFSGAGRPMRSDRPLHVSVTLSRKSGETIKASPSSSASPSADRHVWGSGRGWFSASFGPMRRFSGGDREHDRLYVAQPKLAAHLSLFSEDVALTEISRWLKTLQFQALERDERAQALISDLREFINQPGLLPQQTRLEQISSEGVFFRDGQGSRIVMEELSDGFRSILCLTLELVRQLALSLGATPFTRDERSGLSVQAAGVVLIDEVDAHLHPSWQQDIGWWLTERFPKLQFLVTTHSPLVCHAAQRGSIFRLSKPGQDMGRGGFVRDEALKRLLYGDILEAYGTEVFGAIRVSPKAREWAEELAKLNARPRGELTDAQRERMERLREQLPTTKSQHQDLLDNLLSLLPQSAPMRDG